MNKKNEEIQIAWIHKKPVNIHISDMGFSVRTYNCLRKAGLVTSDEIRRRGSKALLKVRNLGKCGVSEVIERMRRLGNNMDEL
jgi:DNA-directed RNA polymerase subunit alpha